MIERASEFGASAAVPLIGGDTSNQTAGDILRQAREAHGLDVSVVAAALKVPQQKIEALEADDIDALPDPVFARALAASMCRALRIDAQPVLAKLPGAPRPGIGETQRAMSASFKTGVQRTNASFVSKTMIIVVLLLLAGAAALFWLPQSTLDRVSAAVDGVMARGLHAGNTSASAEADASTTPGEASEPAQAPVPMGPTAAGTAPAAGVATGAAAVSPAVTAPAVPAAATATPAADAQAQVLVINARADSWISVSESGGKSLLQRTVPAGESVALSGNLPLAVVIGRAADVDVQVRGKAFDLKPFMRGGTVARFEVKP